MSAIRVNNAGVLAAQLQRQIGHIGVRHQRLAAPSIASHDVEHAGREGVAYEFHQAVGRHRCLIGRLHHDQNADRQWCSAFCSGEHQRVVVSHDVANDADDSPATTDDFSIKV